MNTRGRDSSSAKSSGSSRAKWASCRFSCCANGARASSSSTPTTTSARRTTARPDIWATATSSPSSTASMALPDEASDPRDAAQDRSIRQVRCRGKRVPAARSSTSAMRTSRSTAATGRSSRCSDAVDLPALQDRHRASATTSPSRSSASATTTRRASSCRTGYVGQRTANGLVTCLTDGHPGVSGGGVLDRDGELVGIPIGRMQGDYRFSFILPVRDGDVPQGARRCRRRRRMRGSTTSQRTRSARTS